MNELAKLRYAYATALATVEATDEQLLAEIHQLIVDILDAVEQSEIEYAVIAALDAFNKSQQAGEDSSHRKVTATLPARCHECGEIVES